MNVSLRFRSALVRLSGTLVQELDALTADISSGWGIDHNPDGHHKWVYERGRDTAMGYWKRYQPQWYASTVDPVIGNGVLRGAYTQIGETVFYMIRLNVGSTTTFGTVGSQWRFTLPFPHKWEESLAFEICQGSGRAIDSSASLHYIVDANVNVAAASLPEGLVLVYPAGAGVVTDTVPFTWATGDSLLVRGFYRRIIEPDEN